MGKKSLGKGLSVLISEQNKTADIEGERVINIPVEKIIPNRFQPREKFDEEKLNNLIASIRENGVVQPILVRRCGEKYEIIAGERRHRAVKSLEIKDIPALIKDVTDTELLEYALIENLQRQDLNPIEEAKGYEKLVKDFGFTQDVVAQRVGKDRSTVANCLRILKLPQIIQDNISRGTLSMGHAKALLSIENPKTQISISNKTINFEWSVRRLENVLKNIISGKKTKLSKDQNIVQLEQELQQILGTRVRITHGKKRGHIEIEYFSLDDLDRVLAMLRKAKI